MNPGLNPGLSSRFVGRSNPELLNKKFQKKSISVKQIDINYKLGELMKHILSLSKLNTLNVGDKCYLLFIFFHYLTLLICNNYILELKTFLMYFELFILYFTLVWIYKLHSQNKYLTKPLFYNIFLKSTFIFQVLFTLFLLAATDKNLNQFELYFALTLFVLMLGFGLSNFIVYLIFGSLFVYYIILKSQFPEEKNAVEENDPPMKELSKHLSLSDQKIYLNSFIISLSLYILGLLYFVVFLLTNTPTNNEYISRLNLFNPIATWFNLGNLIGIFSLIMAVFSITLPIASNIKEKALREFNLSNNK